MAITLNQLPEASIGVRGTWFEPSSTAPNYDAVKDAGRVWGFCDTPEGYGYVFGNFDKAYNKAGTEVNRTFVCRMVWGTLELDSWAPTVLPAANSGNGYDGGACYDGVYDSRFGGRVYVCGNFTSFDGVSRNGIVAINASTGAVINIFGSGTNSGGRVRDLDLVNGSLYIGGSFSSVMGTSRQNLARIDFDGSGNPSVNSGFNPGASGPIRGLKGGQTTGGAYRILAAADNGTITIAGQSCRLCAMNESGVSQWDVVTTGNSIDDLDIDNVNKLAKVGSVGALTSGGNRNITYDLNDGSLDWFYASNGDCQAVGHYYDIQLCGYHDKRIASVKNSTTMSLDCSGFWCTSETGALNAWRPQFLSAGSPEATGTLKVWMTKGVETRGFVVIGGDFNQVKGTGGSPTATKRHIAFYKDTSWVDTGPPPPDPTGSGLGNLTSIPNRTGFGGAVGDVNAVSNPGTYVVNDPFTRTNGSSLGVEPVSGLSYSAFDGVWATNGSYAYCVSATGAPGYGGAQLSPGTLTFPYTIEADLTLSANANRVNAGLLFHSSGSRAGGLFFVKVERTVGNPNGLFVIGKHDSGVITYGTRTEPVSLTYGATYHLEVTITATTITARLTGNGIDESCSYTKSGAEQTAVNSLTAFGFRIRYDTADEDDLNSHWDNLRLSANTGTGPGTYTKAHAADATLVSTVTAGKMAWDRIKPDGAGGMMDMCQDAVDPNVWYMACDVGSINVSRDGAVTWEGASIGLYQEVHRKVAGIASYVDPSDGTKSITFALMGQGSSGSVAYSRNKGVSWTITSTGGDLEFNGQNAAAGVGTPALSSVGKPRSVAGLMAFDGTGGGDGYAYFGTYVQGLCRSTNLGTSDTKLGLNGAYIRSVYRDGNNVYVGVLNNGSFRGMYRFGTARTRAAGTTGTGDGQCMPTGVRHVECIFMVGTTMFAVCGEDGVWRNTVAPYDTPANWAQMTGLPGGWWFTGAGRQNGANIIIMLGAHNPSVRTGSKYNSILRCPNAQASIGSLTWEWKSDPGSGSGWTGGNLDIIASDGQPFDPAGESDKFPGNNDCELFSMNADWNTPGHWEVLGGGGCSWGSYDDGNLWKAHSRGSVIVSNRGISPDPQRSGTGLIANQDHDAFRWQSGGDTVVRISLANTTIGYAVHCAYDGSYLIAHGDDNNNEGLVYRSASPGSSGAPNMTRLSYQPGGSGAGATWGNRCLGLWVLKKSNGQPRLLGIFEGLGMYYTDDWGATAWTQCTGYPSPGTPGSDERGTPWQIRSAQYGGAGTDGNVFAVARMGANVGIWHSGNYGASGWTKIATATTNDISQLWVAPHPGDPTVVYFCDGSGDLKRIRNATTSPVIDTIATESEFALVPFFNVDSTSHDFTPDLYVYCRPNGGVASGSRCKMLYKASMSKTATSISWTDYMDTADGALTTQGQAAGPVGVSECCAQDHEVFMAIRSRSTLRGQLV